MGLWHTDLAAILKRYSLQEMKRILDDNGITQIELEWLLDWFCTGERRAVSDQTRQMLLTAAEQLRARHIKIGDMGNDCADIPSLSEEFATLCRQASERGTCVLFEMIPGAFSRVPSLEHALSIVRDAGEKNGGIMLDILHLHRTGTPFEDIVRKIERNIPMGVEINDATHAMPMRLLDSIVNRRLLPGDGELDIAAFLHHVWTWGYEGPIGVEVMNEYIRKWPPDTAAGEAFTKGTQVVAAARASWNSVRS